MDKVFIISKDFFYSEEDHDSEIVLVCSNEDLANELLDSFNFSVSSDRFISYSVESFKVFDYGNKNL